ncbi:bifunctional demethylmenaquinone methyltransferase/2-methoxy-6-polyprenyl-1,4-benzoquinol methylase UbiE [Geomesophilobacter sediminis]|uniref:Demethylmenaquinone methyltransferase n=1 Tax=Geomesophilobacter sediminis TaxID=2798584 RepID=A0A8J7LZ53_9BACT|nr:bifunctional demethylmenaquinone methyltransferase/2-methoxy-6-polyprenyl-1,4-benzoquinol methylase UbiE [Geomesophilobacter sediminis]MBJ6725896.1 bifunctional demethylmenaquinone methyltransferase/2-methoxy-6-polyprenyl-1,4-benzoquinol methylase UbiE [Geomesophilobacter sediminis]
MYALSEKGERIRAMFGSIAPRYDLLNRLLSLGIDQRWRRFAVAKIGVTGATGRVLDVATGTGDVALEIAAQTKDGVTIVGADFCPEMVELGKVKVENSRFRGRISFQVAPCEEMPFETGTFDAATIAFGIRNVVDRAKGLAEMRRVLRDGGKVVILEFSTPTLPIFRNIYHFYFLKVLPKIGGMFSRFSAYQYLPDSVLEFPSRDTFKGMMREVGFKDVQHFDLTGGIATVYVGTK